MEQFLIHFTGWTDAHADGDTAAQWQELWQTGEHMPGKGDSRHRRQQIVAMWGGGLVLLACPSFQKKLEIWICM